MIFIKILIIINSISIIKQCLCDDSNYFTRDDVTQGLVFPRETTVFVGEDVFLKIVHPVTQPTSCAYRFYNDADIEVTESNNPRITAWPGEICGIRITNVTIADRGHWRLTSKNRYYIARGMCSVTVLDKLPTLSNGTYVTTTENVAADGTVYCYVLRPGQPKTEFPMQQKCLLPELNNELDGNGIWTVVAGIYGRTEELTYEINVEPKIEQLKTSVERSTNPNRVSLHCNLINSARNISFCRFLRLIDDVGFNLGTGHGQNKYRYTGAGFINGECGLIIDNPNEVDLTTWKCYIGINSAGEFSTIGAILDLSSVPQSLEDIEATDIYGKNATNIDILCKSKVSIDYCWFLHPNGSRISVSDTKPISEWDTYRYFGTGLKLGECGITLINAQNHDSGIWKCNIGTIQVSRWGASRDINVRISDSYLVATLLNQEVVSGEPIIIECNTVPMHLPIEYCRFVLPNGAGFGINEDVASENALSNTYYFNTNRELARGECSLIVKSATQTHSGKWTCAGKLIGRNEENWDDFNITVIEQGLTVAAIIGMAFGSFIILVIIIVLLIRNYRKRRNLRERTESLSMESRENENDL